MTRRDKCFLTGKRAAKLSESQAACAWWYLAGRLDGMGDLDIPKFAQLLHAIRKATVAGRQSK